MGEEKKKINKYRTLGPISGWASKVILSAIPVCCILFIIDIPTHLGYILYKQQYLGLFLSLQIYENYI